MPKLRPGIIVVLALFAPIVIGSAYLVYRFVYYPGSARDRCAAWLERMKDTDNYYPTRQLREQEAATPACPDDIAIPVLMEMLDRSEGAARALASRHYAPAMSFLLTKLRDGDPKYPYRTLAYFGDDAKGELIAIMVDPSQKMRAAAVAALGAFEFGAIVDDLVPIIVDTRYDVETANMAARALAGHGTSDSAPKSATLNLLTRGANCTLVRRGLPYFIEQASSQTQFEVLDRCTDKDLRERLLSSLIRGQTEARARKWASDHRFLIFHF